MTISTVSEISEAESSPLLDSSVDYGSGVDYKGRPVNRSKSGGWRSAFFIIGVELTERFAYYGISSNLVVYLTGRLGQSKASAAQMVNTWMGVSMLLPILGAFIADSYLGRYRTILIASLLYILGLGLLTLSAVLPSLSSSYCKNGANIMSCSPPQFQVIFFFFSLYLVAVAQGGHKPCVQAFGADQFDGRDSEECKAKSSFFNWWYFGLNVGPMAAYLFLNYIQDNLNWGLGFGIPCISMAVALGVFLIGTRTYRYTKGSNKNPFFRIGKVFVNAARNWRTSSSAVLVEQEAQGTLPHQSSQQFKFLYKALLAPVDSKEEEVVCRISDVEEAKAVLRLVPIWVTCLSYAIVFAQSSTFFTEQGTTMDRSIWPGFDIPPASLQFFITLTIIFLIPTYDRIFVPLARSVVGKPSGITMLERIGAGMLVSIFCMVVSAVVEMKRLKTARDFGLVDMPEATIPMSIWWLVPQYLLLGIGDVFAIVGMQEFFYDQVPNELKSAGLSLYLSVLGVGSFLSSFLIFVIEKTTCGEDQDCWLSDNLNRAHLDYFYWLLAGLSTAGLVTFMFFAKSYIYN
ncbi:major facilitator superfamily protein [Actinidia rufa]|uniref:Major facilitator superfamily protein n=1 Tax=Actinidia rufa TaxID=165716 RepID=A0A7J0GG26_9ERIC|nr:major facilitator superfamily protein [Actinidia rufa]